MLKRIFTPTTFSFVLLSLFLTSCVKESPVSDSNDIIGTWAVTGIRSDVAYDWNGDGRNETDIFNNYSYCQQDIVLVFDYNGYGESRQGCNAAWQNMNWELYGNTLNIDMYSDQLNLDLIQFGHNTIRGEDNIYVDGRNFVITYTLSRR